MGDDDDNGFGAWGGYMAAKKAKLQEQFLEEAKAKSAQLSDIFKGISIFVNGYTNPSSEELKRIMALHGGVYHHYQVTGPKSTTHIIASNLPNVKITQLGFNAKIVKPNWIPDSVKAGRLLDYKEYLLYTNQSVTQPKLNFGKSDGSPNNVLNSVNTTTSSDQQTNLNTNINPKDVSSKVKTAVDPNFLSEFYNNSRLHLISTLGAAFKQQINELRDKADGKFPARQRLKDVVLQSTDVTGFNVQVNREKITMHIDMDSFFVSVGLLTRPELKGQPVAVTHARADQQGPARPEREIELQQYRQRLEVSMQFFSSATPIPLRDNANLAIISPFDGIDGNNSMSEIASCSYEARKAGVSNGMFLGTACKICPNLKTIPYDFDEYKRIAHILYDIVARYTLEIEAVSCDEMFVDITELLRDTKATVNQWAEFIRNEIKTTTKCPCSTGFGANRLQARLATRQAKPDGQFHLLTENVENYMLDIDVNSLPGVGRALSYKLKVAGLKTCADLQNLTLARLQSEFGTRIGEALFDHCRGKDERPLSFEHIRKSVSAEINYGIRFKSNDETEIFLRQLCEEVHSRLSEISMKGKCITLKYMVRSKDAPVESSKFMGHGLCDNITKSSSLHSAVSDLAAITREIISLSRKLAIIPSDLRGIGIQVSRLEKIERVVKRNALTEFLQKDLKSNKDTSVECTQTGVSTRLKERANVENKTKAEIGNFTGNKAHDEPLNITSTDRNKNSIKQFLRNTQKSDLPTKNIQESIEVGKKVNLFNKISSKTIKKHKSVNEIVQKQISVTENTFKRCNSSSLVKLKTGDFESNKNLCDNNVEFSDDDLFAEDCCSTTENRNDFINFIPKDLLAGSQSTAAIESEQMKIYNDIKEALKQSKIQDTPKILTSDSVETVVLRSNSTVRGRGRGRGRPRGSRNGQATRDILPCRLKSPSNNKLDRFVKPIEQEKFNLAIDPEFLAALPEDIRKEMLQNYETNQNNKMNSKSVEPSTTTNTNITIDEDFLKQLPEDIRLEVIKEYNLSDITKIPIQTIDADVASCKENLGFLENPSVSSLINVEPHITQCSVLLERVDNPPKSKDSSEKMLPYKTTSELPKKIQNEIMNEKTVQEENFENENIDLSKLSWEELKHLLKQWLETYTEPTEVDINIFANFTYELAMLRKTELLFLLLKFLHRILSEQQNCDWHKAYFHIVSKAQEGMLQTYHSKLLVNMNVCKNCNE